MTVLLSRSISFQDSPRTVRKFKHSLGEEVWKLWQESPFLRVVLCLHACFYLRLYWEESRRNLAMTKRDQICLGFLVLMLHAYIPLLFTNMPELTSMSSSRWGFVLFFLGVVGRWYREALSLA